MPYIKQEDRERFNAALQHVPEFTGKGELEYCIYYLMIKYMESRDFTYSNLHDVVYAAIHCGDEFRRRNLDIRENQAIENNGDIICSALRTKV